MSACINTNLNVLLVYAGNESHSQSVRLGRFKTVLFNPLTLMSDQDRISPDKNINTLSTR